jgi:glycosyltransferase involved in cell wall biosynthesis
MPSKIAQRLADRYIDAYFFASRDMGLDWINKGNLSSPDKIHGVMEVSSVFHPLEREAALAETGVEGQPVFLWVGRLEANKDPLTVVKGFLKFTEDKPLARLYMIYQTEELIAPITRLLDADLNNTITLVGKVPHAQLLYWFNSADFIISGSHYEGSGTVVCEAMSCGCVPVVTDIPSFKMMTDNGKFGLLYEAGNADALHLALLESCKLDRSEMKENVMAYYRTKLSFAAIAAEIERVALSL